MVWIFKCLKTTIIGLKTFENLNQNLRVSVRCLEESLRLVMSFNLLRGESYLGGARGSRHTVLTDRHTGNEF